MTETVYELGQRVWASHSGTGFPRPGVVSITADNNGGGSMFGGDREYGVTFDGDTGPSYPCVILRAERGSEAVPSRIGTGS